MILISNSIYVFTWFSSLILSSYSYKIHFQLHLHIHSISNLNSIFAFTWFTCPFSYLSLNLKFNSIFVSEFSCCYLRFHLHSHIHLTSISTSISSFQPHSHSLHSSEFEFHFDTNFAFSWLSSDYHFKFHLRLHIQSELEFQSHSLLYRYFHLILIFNSIFILILIRDLISIPSWFSYSSNFYLWLPSSPSGSDNFQSQFSILSLCYIPLHFYKISSSFPTPFSIFVLFISFIPLSFISMSVNCRILFHWFLHIHCHSPSFLIHTLMWLVYKSNELVDNSDNGNYNNKKLIQ